MPSSPAVAKKRREKNAGRKAQYDRDRYLLLTPEQRLNRYRDPIREMFKGACKRAKAKGLKCTITPSDIEIPDICPLLGIPLFSVKGSRCATPNSPTLDRIINELGYIPGNVWVISHKANTCKGTLSADEIVRIGTRLRKKLKEIGSQTVLLKRKRS